MKTNPLLGLIAALTISFVAVAEDELQAVVDTCAVCHGEYGIATQPLWPNLAGQKVGYLRQQLQAFRSGERQAPEMNQAAKALTDEQIEALAVHYSQQPLPEPKADQAIDTTAGQHVRAYCVSCHSMSGRTVNTEWPNLAGQNAEYLYKQLQAFQSGERASPIMSVIVKNFSDQQLKDVADYYSQQ